MLGKLIGPDDDYAESWEVVDHREDQSVVLAGPHAGRRLGDLVREAPEELLGKGLRPDRFPLLLKFLDCNRTLSVQVHPDDQQAANLDPPDLGKTEAWVVLAAEPNSSIYAGLRPGVDRQTLASAVQEGTCEACLHRFTARPGDVVFIPAGTVHALGAGLVIAEIQQASDTTFRLFDWGRVDRQGNARPLHIEQSLEVIDFARGPVDCQVPQPTEDPQRERLVACEKFRLDRLRFRGERTVGGEGCLHLLAVLEGAVRISSDPVGESLAVGNSALIPASCPPLAVAASGDVVMLDITLPAGREGDSRPARA
jgi:mannose-6-phosphate isomerase